MGTEIILHENPYGIQIIREDMKKRSKVTVRIAGGEPIRTYRFNLIPDQFDCPYISWANLDHCGGWVSDGSYLDTAVQNGLKLYAGRTQALKCSYLPNYPSMEEALTVFKKLSATLPEGVIADQEELIESDGRCLHTFICRTGTIADHIDLDAVFDFYEKLGITVPTEEVRRLCNIEIKQYGLANAPFVYFNAKTAAELITTGLLLGYPLESTASILTGH